MTTPEHREPNPMDEMVPFVDRAIIDELIDVGMRDEPAFIASEKQEISRNNPYLRDLITMLAAKKEPDDLEARKHIIESSYFVIEAIDRALLAQKLNELLSDNSDDDVNGKDILQRLEEASNDTPPGHPQSDVA